MLAFPFIQIFYLLNVNRSERINRKLWSALARLVVLVSLLWLADWYNTVDDIGLDGEYTFYNGKWLNTNTKNKQLNEGKTCSYTRAVKYPNLLPQVHCGNHAMEWISSLKYLGCWLTTMLGWRNILRKIRVTVRQKTALVNSFRFRGTSSTQLRRVLFSNFVLPHFTWLFAIFPLFTDTQRTDPIHLYFTLLKRI